MCRDARSLMSLSVMPCPWANTSTFSQARAVICLRVQCRRLHLNALWMLNGVFFFSSFLGESFFGGCVIRGWERTWTAVQLFHCFNSASQHGTSPAHFGLLIKGKHNAQYDSIRNKCRHVRLYRTCYLIVTGEPIGLHWKQPELILS